MKDPKVKEPCQPELKDESEASKIYGTVDIPVQDDTKGDA